MSEDKSQNEPEQTEQEPERPEGMGAYHPQAAQHEPYNQAMAAWFNEVKSMQIAGTLPAPREESEPEAEEPEVPEQRPATEPDLTKEPEQPEIEPVPEKVSEPLQETPETPAEVEASEAPAEQPEEPEEAQDTQAEPERPGPGETYDPAEHNAPNVLGYLEGVDFDEAVRVLDLEAKGKNRKGILNLQDEILERAQANSTEDAPQE